MPAIYLLYAYIFVAALGGLFYFFNVFHIVKFGLNCSSTRWIAVIYSALYVGLVLLGLWILSGVDWSVPIQLILPSLPF
jgi:hypothetical protein